jgi:hypothetical protein
LAATQAARHRLLLEAAGAAVASNDLAALASTTLGPIARAFDSPLVLLYRMGRVGSEETMEGWSSLGAAHAREASNEYHAVMKDDPHQAVKRRINPRLEIISDYVSSAEVNRSPVRAS